jgi:4-amino-4-deoxy-L-arabinose transferase-like glycosyltransferase
MAIAVLLFVVAVVARAVSALIFLDAAYPDAYYYASVGASLAAGRGFEVDYIWNFVDVGGLLPAQGVLPIPSNGHWMPLAALVQVPFLWLLGPTPIANALPFWIASGLTAGLTWYIARDARLGRWQSAAAGLLVAMPGGLAPYLGQPDNFSIFMLLGALALWLCGRGLRGDRRAYALGGLVVGLAFLARTDGFLLGVPFALAAVADLLRRPRLSRLGGAAIALCALGFVVVVAPWLLRQLDVFGSVSPSAANGRILWITEYDQLYSVSSDTTLESFLRQGIGALAWSRIGGLAFALILFASLPLLFVLVPFVPIGVARRWREPDFAPWLIYAVALFAFTALVSAVHVPFGTFIHSAVALVPHAYLLALVGIATTVGWLGRRRPGWDIRRATRNITAMLVVIVLVVSAGATLATMRAWDAERQSREAVLGALADVAAPGDVVMSADAGAYAYHGGWPGVVTPADPLPVVEEAARLYDVRWLVLEAAHIVPSLVPVLTGQVRPPWLSDPVLVVEASVTDDAGGPEAGTDEAIGEDPLAGAADSRLAGAPRSALYAVCLRADDRRCDR